MPAGALGCGACSGRRPIRLVLYCRPTEKKVVLLDFFDACVVFFRRKPWDLVSDGCLYAPSIINRHAVAKLIEPLMHSVPKVAAVMNDFDFALRDAREQSDLTLARLPSTNTLSTTTAVHRTSCPSSSPWQTASNFSFRWRAPERHDGLAHRLRRDVD